VAECFYCGTDTKLTRAHLFHQDIRAALPNESTEVTLAASSIRAGGLIRDHIYTGDVREMYVKILCDPCNRLWMEPIEKAASPIIESIMDTRRVPPTKDLFRLAHWATIVGALRNADRPQFRRSCRPPPSNQVHPNRSASGLRNALHLDLRYLPGHPIRLHALRGRLDRERSWGVLV